MICKWTLPHPHTPHIRTHKYTTHTTPTPPHSHHPPHMAHLCPWKISCDSSTTFHILTVRSLMPAVTGRSRLRQSIEETLSWWPNLQRKKRRERKGWGNGGRVRVRRTGWVEERGGIEEEENLEGGEGEKKKKREMELKRRRRRWEGGEKRREEGI